MAIAPPTFVADELVTATKMNLLPKGIIAYAQATASQTGITTLVDLTGLTVTFTAAASRLYKITGVVQTTQLTNASAPTVIITTGANVQVGSSSISLSVNFTGHLTPIALVTPSAGSVTYKLRASSANASMSAVAGATGPNIIIVEDLGAV